MNGGSPTGAGPLRLPAPTTIAEQPTLADAPTLLARKLSVYIGSPGRRVQDATDTDELIIADHLPRSYELPEPVREQYGRLRDGLRAEA